MGLLLANGCFLIAVEGPIGGNFDAEVFPGWGGWRMRFSGGRGWRDGSAGQIGRGKRREIFVRRGGLQGCAG